MSPIALIGMPGCGKTTIGRVLAKRLERPWLDADAFFEQRMGMSVKNYFAQHGEAAFRDIETQLLGEILQQQPTIVLSTGGGVVVREANRQLLREGADCIYLRTTLTVLWRRLSRDTHRPLLQVADPRLRLQELLTQREPLYTEAAARILDTRSMTSAQVSTLLAAQLELQPIPYP